MSGTRRAVITGVTGQDGWYLASLLLGRGDEVVGIARRAGEVPAGVSFVLLDAGDQAGLTALLAQVQPHELYHLAGETFVPSSWDDAAASRQAPVALAESVLGAWQSAAAGAHLVVASSSEVFAGATRTPQDESCPLAPLTPYGEGKAEVVRRCRELRRSPGGHVSVAFLYNHESPRRPGHFLSRKVTHAAAAIALGLERTVSLGRLDTRRDWGFAGDHMDALTRMAGAGEGNDYVIGTGVSRTVAELCDAAFRAVGLDYREHVRTDPALVRAVDTTHLVADSTRARELLGWVPATSFEAMIGAMVTADLERLREAQG